MGYNIDYLLRYVSMDTYNKIINSNNDYVLGLLSDNYIFLLDFQEHVSDFLTVSN